jgi:short-subunit dehydrogenase
VAELRAAGAEARGYRLDVTDAGAIRGARQLILEEGGPIDVLVNNAGVVFGGPFLDVPIEKHLLTYRVNTLGVVAMTHVFLPDLLSRPEAHIVNIASASGFIGLPNGATYASSKWAVIGFSESLHLELREQGHARVGVTAVCPSYVATGMFAGVKPPLFTSMLSPEKLGEKVVRAVEANRRAVLAPWLVKVTPILKGILPQDLFYVVGGWLGATSGMHTWTGRK